MTLLYLFYFYVLNITPTTVADNVTPNLEIYTEQCCEMIDDIEKIAKALCIEADIAGVKKSILTDKGFYVPDELLKEGVCSIDQLGTYPHADTDIKKSMHANKALMDNLNAKTIELMAFLNHCTDQIPHSVITKLLYDIMRFNCRESWILLRIYKGIDDCDAKLKMVSDNPHATNPDASISDIYELDSITLSQKFVFWQEDMEKRRKDILTQIITYKSEMDNKSAQNLTLEIDIMFDNLKSHCNNVKTYAKDLKLVLHILDSSKNTDCPSFISDLDKFVRNIIISGILTANLLAKEVDNYISLYRNIETKRNIRRDILDLERIITSTIHSILDTNKGLVERYKVIIEIYNDGNKENIFRPLDAKRVMKLTFKAYYDVLELIQGVTNNRIPFSYSNITGISYDTH